MLRFILLIFLALGFNTANAAFPPSPGGYEYTSNVWGGTAGSAGWHGTYQEVCQVKLESLSNAVPPGYMHWIENSQHEGCEIRFIKNGSPELYFGYYWKKDKAGFACPAGTDAANCTWRIRRIEPFCPANSTLVGGSCVCNSGFIEKNQSCKAPSCKVGAVVGAGYIGMGPSASSTWCEAGCIVQPDELVIGEDYLTYANGKHRQTGEKCDVTPETEPEKPEQNPSQTCPSGQYGGTVNGNWVCAKAGNNDTVQNNATKVKETSNPDGTKTTERIQETYSCTGSGACTTTSTVHTTITNQAGDVISSTTTTNSTSGAGTPGSGSSSGGGDDEGDGEGEGSDFCEKNPDLNLCKNSSFNGNCASGFSHDGDAIQGALAKEVHRFNCELSAATPEAAAYEASKANTGNTTGDNPNNGEFSIGPGSFNSTDAIGGSSCIADKTIEVMGKSIILPFSALCDELAMLGNILLAVSFLMAARIVTRG